MRQRKKSIETVSEEAQTLNILNKFLKSTFLNVFKELNSV